MAVPNVAVIGLGIWGKNHALSYADYDRCELALVCDADRERAREVGENLGVPWTDDAADVAASDVDGVSIATPDHLHTAVTIEMLNAGKNVFVEKPLATSVDDARRLAAAAAESGKIAIVDFQNRWNPAFMGIKDAVANGEVGPPVMGYARLSDSIAVAESWLSWAGRSGPEWFLFPHTIDIARWIVGQEPVSVYALGKRGILASRGIDCWDAIQALVQFESCFFTFETSWVVPAGFSQRGGFTLRSLRRVGQDRLRLDVQRPHVCPRPARVPVDTDRHPGPLRAPHPFRVRAHAAFRRLPGRDRHPGDQLR